MSGEAAVRTPQLVEAAPPEKLHFLMVEDNPVDVELVQRELRRAEFDFTSVAVQTPEDFICELRAHCPTIVLADYNLPQWSGMEALDILRREKLDTPLILISGALGEVNAVECLKQGATDYVLKGALARLPVAIRRALEERRLHEQRNRAEEALARHVEELRRSNAELEQFAYVASHDLQEPLRMVASYAELLAERYKGKLDDRADMYIKYAVEGARRMQTLIHDLLAYARVTSAARPLQPIDSSVVLADVIQQLRAAIEGSQAEIKSEAMPMVSADEGQLRQVFQNLIANAIKFHGDGPPHVEIRAESTEKMWNFAVADDGIGIPEESGRRLFQMFQRLHTREEYEGSGIGLAISKRIVERHGGSIWFDSVPGKGTTFHFTIPKNGGGK
jgi:signal transduction histidine kinase